MSAIFKRLNSGQLQTPAYQSHNLRPLDKGGSTFVREVIRHLADQEKQKADLLVAFYLSATQRLVI
jgi:hypothetical protein